MKMNRVVIAALVAAIVAVCVTACGKNDDPTVSDTAIVSEVSETDNDTNAAPTETPRTTVEARTSYISDEMYANATKFANVNLTRLSAVMRKAEAKEPVTVAVIGGSITQGSSASKPENSYAAIMRDWWEQTFPDTPVTYVNAGIGGTDSYLGVHRMNEDLLEYKPDFVIVEFSVNDEDGNFYKATYENVVRRILLQDNEPAVLLLYMTQDNGTSAQPSHGFVGFYYELPQLSYHDMIMNEVRSGAIAWGDISPDNIHPNDKGHAICGELIWKYLNSVYAAGAAACETGWTVKDTPLTTDAYINARILDNRTLQADSADGFAAESVAWNEFANGWQTKNGGSITFTVTAKRIGILFYRSVSGTYGIADIAIDGVSVRSLDADFSGGWGNSVYALQLFSESEPGSHTVTVTVPEGQCFDVLGILVAD